MAKRMVVIAGVITSVLVMAILAEADVPQLISFQDKLYDNADNPLTGQSEITFRIYDVEEGGVPLWSETDSVDCEGGLYNVILGLKERRAKGRERRDNGLETLGLGLFALRSKSAISSARR